MHGGSAAGVDGAVNEIWREIPLGLVSHIYSLFRERAKAADDGQESDNWKTICYFAIMKSTNAKLFTDMRFLGKQASLQKWYQRFCRPQLRAMTRITPLVCTVGFKPGRSVAHITGIISTLMRDAFLFGFPLVMPVGDILTAFDLLSHRDIARALTSKGTCSVGVRAELRELADIKLTLELPGGVRTGQVPLQKTGIQGGVRTPDQFNAVLESALKTTVQAWQELGWGILLDNGFRLTHLIWADNAFLFESDIRRASDMAKMVTEALASFNLFWNIV